jgi:rRNA maturation endonuclease Nob1
MDDDLFVKLLNQSSRNAVAARRSDGADCVRCLRFVPAKLIDFDDERCNCPFCGSDVMLVDVNEDILRAFARQLKGVS